MIPAPIEINHATAALMRTVSREMAREYAQIEPGYWLIRLVKGGPRVAARIWWVETVVDPDFPENRMDGTRSPFFAAEIDGAPADLITVWMGRLQSISEQEYRFRVADSAWARQHKPDEPIANPRRRIDLMTAPLPF